MLKVFKYGLLALILIGCSNINNNNSSVESEKNNEQYNLAEDLVEINESNREELYSLNADFDKDGKLDLATIEVQDSTVFFNIFEANSKIPVISNEQIIFDYYELGADGLHYISLSFDSTNQNIHIQQEIGSARPEGVYDCWFSYRNEIWMVDSVGLEKKSFDLDSIHWKSTTKNLDVELKFVNLIEEFNSLKLEE